ncbi:MAG: NosD domain-containing protein [Promethearchaeota archaeon]
MKKPYRIYGFVVVCFLCIGIAFTYSTAMMGKTDSSHNHIARLKFSHSMNVSDYITLELPAVVHDPDEMSSPFRINIYEGNPNYTWSKWVSEYKWCSGSGTNEDPYVIENLYINCKGKGGGIFVRNSTKPFIIRNCWIHNGGPNQYDAGILIQEASKGTITDCILNYLRTGIWIQFSCRDIVVSHNLMVHNTNGSRAFDLNNDCKYITYDGNYISNYGEGAYVSLNYDVTFTHNFMNNTLFGKDAGRPPITMSRTTDTNITFNGFAGAYANYDEFLTSIDSLNITVSNNTKVTTPGESPKTTGITPKIQSNEGSSLITLTGCSFSTIAHNIMYVSRSGAGVDIPGYDMWMIYGLLGVISLLVILKKVVKK